MKIFIIIPFLLFSVSLSAQNERIKYIKKIQEICPNADIIEYESKTDYVEIEFICDDEVYENAYDNQLNLIYSETETEIPEVILGIIHKKLNKKFNGWILDETSLVIANDTSYYRIEILVDGIEQNNYFTLEGKNFKSAGISSQESWNSTNLSTNKAFQKAPYSFLKPNEVYDLPDILREVSGISIINDSIVYCIQDELGIVFKYNLNANSIDKIIRFTDIGDFEDIIVNENKIYVLRSDGAIFQIDEKNFNGISQPSMMSTNSLNIEGLTFDKKNNRYLMISKDMPIEGESDDRNIYTFANIKAKPTVFQKTNTSEIKELVEKNYPELDIKYLQFNPSAIAVHPLTDQIYILSATNRIIAIYEKGKLVNVLPLPAELYYKPEGLSFAIDGTLYISSEGAKNGSVAGQIVELKKK